MPTKTPAAIYVEQGKPMVIDDIDLPDPGPTQVLVRQFATGICHSQLHELDPPVVDRERAVLPERDAHVRLALGLARPRLGQGHRQVGRGEQRRRDETGQQERLGKRQGGAFGMERIAVEDSRRTRRKRMRDPGDRPGVQQRIAEGESMGHDVVPIWSVVTGAPTSRRSAGSAPSWFTRRPAEPGGMAASATAVSTHPTAGPLAIARSSSPMGRSAIGGSARRRHRHRR